MSSLYINESLSKKILEYNAFTDIAFNQEKPINCQTRSAAIFVSLYKLGKIETVPYKYSSEDKVCKSRLLLLTSTGDLYISQ